MASKTTNAKRLTGYVIHSAFYRDSDAMISFFSSEGVVSFLARGIRKIPSKNAAVCSLLAKSEVVLNVSSSGGMSLKEGNLISYPDGGDSLTRLAVYQFLAELNHKALTGMEEAVDLYPYLDKAMEAIASGQDAPSLALFYFAHLLRYSGYSLAVDGCVFCDKSTDIVGLSYHDGGFLCREHCLNEGNRLPPRMIHIIRFLFKSDLSHLPRAVFRNEESLLLLQEFGRYYEDLTGVRLNSLKVIGKLA